MRVSRKGMVDVGMGVWIEIGRDSDGCLSKDRTQRLCT